MPRTRCLLLPAGLALFACLFGAPAAYAQSTYTWSNAGNGWLNPANWTGGPSGTWPGVTAASNPANGTVTDLALIGDHSGSNQPGIDMTAAGGALSVGGIWLNAPDTPGISGQVRVGNTAAVGSAFFSNSVLQLNGSAIPVNGLSNVILANTSPGIYDLRIMPDPAFGNAQMTLSLGTATGNVLVSPGRSIMIDTPVVDAAGVTGGFTVQGGGSLVMTGTNSYTGTTGVVGSLLLFQTVGSTQPSAIDNRGQVLFGSGVNVTQSGNLSGSGSFYKSSSSSTLTLSGTNSHTGTTYVAGGGLTFASAASLGGAEARYHFRDNVTISASYAIDQGLLDRIDPNSFGFVALATDSPNNLTFSSALANRISLGATGNRTYSGSLNVAGTAYRLGGGGGTLTVSSALVDGAAPRGVVVTSPGTPVSTVVLSGASAYTGSTVIDGHAVLQVATVNNGGTAGPLGASSSAAGNLVFRGGGLYYTGPTAVTDRGFTLNGAGSIGIAGPIGTSLTFDGDLSRNAGGTLSVSGYGTITLTTINGGSPGSALVGGVLPWAMANGGFATLNGNSVVYANPDYVVSSSQPLSGASPTSNVSIGVSQNQTTSGSMVINSLITASQVNVNGTLILTSGGLMMSGSGSTLLTSGSSAGFLTAGRPTDTAASLYLWTPVTGVSPQQDVRVQIVDNSNPSGVIPVSLVKDGDGILILRGQNTYTGGTTINSGVVYLDSPGAGAGPGTLGTGAVTINEGNLSNFTSNGLTTGLLVRGAATIPNAITIGPGSGGIVGIGSTGSTNGANMVFTGDITVNRPTMLVGGGGENTGGTYFTGTFSGTGDLVVTTTGNNYRVVLAPSGTNAFGNVYLAGSSVLQIGNNSLSSNRVIPDGSNVYFAPGSELRISTTTPGAAADGEAVNALISQSYGAGSIHTANSGDATLRYGLTIGSSNGSGEFSGTIFEDANRPQITIAKIGTGTQVFSGANTYTGGTRVLGGSLLVGNVTGSGTGSGSVTVASGATLGGNGILSPSGTGNRVVVQSSGTLTAGTQTGLGQTDLTISGNGLRMEDGSTYRVRVFGTGPLDVSRVSVIGTGTDQGAQIDTNKMVLDLAGVDMAALRAAVGAGNTRTYIVMSADRLYSDPAATNKGFDASGFSIVNNPGFASGEWAFGAFDTGAGTATITFTPVPEPGLVLSIGATGLALVGRMRRLRKSER